MKFTINQSHIERGVPGDGCRCAAALAIQEQAPHLKFFLLESDELLLGTNGNCVSVPTPANLRSFIGVFDACEDDNEKDCIKPIEFELEVAA
jgi:hypothetical protein